MLISSRYLHMRLCYSGFNAACPVCLMCLNSLDLLGQLEPHTCISTNQVSPSRGTARAFTPLHLPNRRVRREKKALGGAVLDLAQRAQQSGEH